MNTLTGVNKNAALMKKPRLSAGPFPVGGLKAHGVIVFLGYW